MKSKTKAAKALTDTIGMGVTLQRPVFNEPLPEDPLLAWAEEHRRRKLIEEWEDQAKSLSDAINDYTRVKLREESFFRKILPPVPVK